MRIHTLAVQASLTVGEPQMGSPEAGRAARDRTGADSRPGVLAEISDSIAGAEGLPPDLSAWAHATYGTIPVRRMPADPASEPPLIQRMADTAPAPAPAARPPAPAPQVPPPPVAPAPVAGMASLDLAVLADRVYQLLAEELRRERAGRL